MGVDVFGRHSKKTEGKAGPPGIGFKFTSEGQFDIDHKRLCNLEAPLEPNDAVNLQALKNLVSSEVLNLYEVIKTFQSEVDNLSSLVKTYKTEVYSEVQKKVNNLIDLVNYDKNEVDKIIDLDNHEVTKKARYSTTE